MKKMTNQYPEATKICLVRDNLNTHQMSSFYQNLPDDEAFELAQRFEFFYTIKSASWLNMTVCPATIEMHNFLWLLFLFVWQLGQLYRQLKSNGIHQSILLETQDLMASHTAIRYAPH